MGPHDEPALVVALEYASRGWAVFPAHSMRNGACTCGRPDCRDAAKHPRTPHGLKDATTDADQIRHWWTQWPDANVAIATGGSSKLVVLDVDTKSGGEESLGDIGKLPDTIEVLTGGGGRHFYFTHPGGTIGNSASRLAPGLDIRGDGGYVIAPPSVHASGKRYLFDAMSSPDLVDPAPLPEGLLPAQRALSSTSAVAEAPAVIGNGARNQTLASLAGTMRKRGMSRESIEAALQAENAARCQPPLPSDEVAEIARSISRYPPATRESAVPATAARPPALAIIQGGRRDDDEDVPDGGLFDLLEQSYAFLVALIREPRGQAVAFGGRKLEYDEMAGSVTLNRQAIRDSDYSRARELIEMAFVDKRNGKRLKFSTTDIVEASRQVAEENRYHPIRDYLDSLEWDGTPRVHKVLPEILGAEDSEIMQKVMRRWFISAVARVYKPGCKVDTVLVFIGRQGAKKSTFFDTLSNPWFADTAIDISTKDALQILSRLWIYEWSEMEAMNRAREVTQIKAFISSRSDYYRPPYAREPIDVPRGCVIVGSTNEPEFLTDSTGNRRFWPIVAGTNIDTARLASERDQLWAEAKAAFRAGESWWLNGSEEDQFDGIRRRHEAEDAWESMVVDYIQTRDERGATFSSAELLEKAVGKHPGQWNKLDMNRIAGVMRSLGFKNNIVYAHGTRARRWGR